MRISPSSSSIPVWMPLSFHLCLIAMSSTPYPVPFFFLFALYFLHPCSHIFFLSCYGSSVISFLSAEYSLPSCPFHYPLPFFPHSSSSLHCCPLIFSFRDTFLPCFFFECQFFHIFTIPSTNPPFTMFFHTPFLHLCQLSIHQSAPCPHPPCHPFLIMVSAYCRYVLFCC